VGFISAVVRVAAVASGSSPEDARWNSSAKNPDEP
jgi:hypothetical protein